MGDPVPTPEEILALAHDIVEGAVQRQATVDLGEPEGADTEWHYSTLRQQYSWIVDAFARALAYAPDPASLDSLVQMMKDGESALTGGQELGLTSLDINGDPVRQSTQLHDPFWSDVMVIHGDVEGWSGDAAKNFRGNFLGQLSVAPANQALLFRSLNFAMRATKGVYEQFLRDLKSLAEAAKHALHPGIGRSEVSALLGLAAGVSKIAAGAATLSEGGVFVGFEGGFEIALAVKEAGAEGRGEEYPIEGVDADGILESTNEGLTRITGHLDQCEQAVLESIGTNQKVFASKRDYFVAPAPSVVDLSGKPKSTWKYEWD